MFLSASLVTTTFPFLHSNPCCSVGQDQTPLLILGTPFSRSTFESAPPFPLPSSYFAGIFQATVLAGLFFAVFCPFPFLSTISLSRRRALSLPQAVPTPLSTHVGGPASVPHPGLTPLFPCWRPAKCIPYPKTQLDLALPSSEFPSLGPSSI